MNEEKTQIAEIKVQIEALKGKLSSSKKKSIETSGLNLSIMIISDLAGGLLVGAGIGYMLYALFDVHLVVLALFVLFGGFAGLLNVYKSISHLEKGKHQ